MPWWVWIGVALMGVYAVLAFLMRNRNRRVEAEILIHENAPPTIQLGPASAEAADLSLGVLCYASKVWWLLQSEFEPSREIFRELIYEAIDFWSGPKGDLISRMPSAAAIRDRQDPPRSVPGGERFKIACYRTGYGNLPNRAWVINSLPRPGMAANIPWSVVLFLNAVWIVIPSDQRVRLHNALAGWADEVLSTPTIPQTQESLRHLFKVSLAALSQASG